MLNLLAGSNTFELFGITIHWYGVILTSAMLIAFFLFLYLAKKNDIESDFSLTMFLLAVTLAIVGARLVYVVPRFNEYFTSWEGFLRAFNISEGGLTIMGGIPGGAIGIMIACKIYNKSVFRVFDLVIPCLLLGQVIGRWGNYVNGELYGMLMPIEALQFFPFSVWVYDPELGAYGWHCANFFYEMVLNFIAFIIVMVVIFKYKDKIKVGLISLFYVLWYCLVRGLLEFVKVGQLYWGNVRAVQLICFLAIPIVLVFIVLVQMGKIKLETEKMYERHFKIVHEPPPFEEENDTIEELESIVENKLTDEENENSNDIGR